MVCFDYEEVECSKCHHKTIDEYNVIKGKIVCGSCIEAEQNICEVCGSDVCECNKENKK
jgi:hypothetical protein